MAHRVTRRPKALSVVSHKMERPVAADVAAWSIFGALCLYARARSNAYAFADAGRFHVEISQPLVGLTTRY